MVQYKKYIKPSSFAQSLKRVLFGLVDVAYAFVTERAAFAEGERGRGTERKRGKERERRLTNRLNDFE